MHEVYFTIIVKHIYVIVYTNTQSFTSNNARMGRTRLHENQNHQFLLGRYQFIGKAPETKTRLFDFVFV